LVYVCGIVALFGGIIFLGFRALMTQRTLIVKKKKVRSPEEKRLRDITPTPEDSRRSPRRNKTE